MIPLNNSTFDVWQQPVPPIRLIALPRIHQPIPRLVIHPGFLSQLRMLIRRHRLPHALARPDSQTMLRRLRGVNRCGRVLLKCVDAA